MPLSNDKKSALKGTTLSIFAMFTMVISTYTLAESCPPLSSISSQDVNGTFHYSAGAFKGSNADTGVEPENVDYSKKSGVKFTTATLAQRKVGSEGEDPADKPGSIISYVKCDYEGSGADDRVRLSQRTTAFATEAKGTWEKDTQENSANTHNKKCSASDVTDCEFNLP
ncbi:DUF3757 domain-containing protein [Pseudomonas sp. B26(2017)]|uniref:DUF3757 domain-containing protein n=1 Tax=Pseudomonas sp. B26(2017) TaxID=1981732 RepID=UPI00148291B6|nr:DUF3757 domain-containing protein [Pseudomonas sp. B26(2017)]